MLKRILPAPCGWLLFTVHEQTRERVSFAIQSFGRDGWELTSKIEFWDPEPTKVTADRHSLDELLVELGQFELEEARSLANEIVSSWIPEAIGTGNQFPRPWHVQAVLVAIGVVATLAVIGVALMILMLI